MLARPCAVNTPIKLTIVRPGRERPFDVTITRALADEVGTDDADPRRVELRRVL